ncbi:DUF2249 domain-containing protein [Aeribacillus composti]|jgi:Predicted redox protein, regulator of disulfide bond formation|uniref:DUF2249 domain-containing protein n=1 Tax=Aeribacillus composti TaxID=1868734 RepID=A0ABY9WBT7_9BACI|nr:DUF2249 domain-containing protein [Aeribacillus composti]WNF31532.1 DUF2249 domain-containing protein [Aeribacillus composti]
MILDNRGLEPPQPMMRTLTALAKLKKGETLKIINDRRPMFLFEQLDDLGYTYQTQKRSDGSYEITIEKKDDDDDG